MNLWDSNIFNILPILCQLFPCCFFLKYIKSQTSCPLTYRWLGLHLSRIEHFPHVTTTHTTILHTKKTSFTSIASNTSSYPSFPNYPEMCFYSWFVWIRSQTSSHFRWWNLFQPLSSLLWPHWLVAVSGSLAAVPPTLDLLCPCGGV